MSKKYNRREQKDEYSVFLKHIQNEKDETSAFAKTLLVIVLIFCGAILGMLLMSDNEGLVKSVFGPDSQITKIIMAFSENRGHQRADFTFPFLPHRQNVLFLGVDSNGSETDPWRGTRSDTIIVMNIDPHTKSVNAISVPRDSKVYLAGDNSAQKINAAHAIGGVRMTKATIEQTLGIKIDRYIIVHDDAVRKIVDAIGGVPIYVEKNMHYNDNAGNLHINLQKGENVLYGRDAVGYLRFRHDGLGDIGRTQRQQWFMRGLIERLKQPQTIAKIPEILKVANTYIKTDMSVYELSQYAALAKSLDMDGIEVSTLPGGPNKHGHTSYWILDPDKTQEVVNRLIYRDRIAAPDGQELKAGILYTSNNYEKAMAIKNELETAGIKIGCTSQTSATHAQFRANSNFVSKEYFNTLKKQAPKIDKYQFIYDPAQQFCPSCDFVIVVAGGMN